MSTITDEGRKIASDGFQYPLVPSSEDRSVSIEASVAFGPFTEGDWIWVSVSETSHIASGGSDVSADAGNAVMAAGERHFVIPIGVTHVALYSAVSGALGSVTKAS